MTTPIYLQITYGNGVSATFWHDVPDETADALVDVLGAWLSGTADQSEPVSGVPPRVRVGSVVRNVSNHRPRFTIGKTYEVTRVSPGGYIYASGDDGVPPRIIDSLTDAYTEVVTY